MKYKNKIHLRISIIVLLWCIGLNSNGGGGSVEAVSILMWSGYSWCGFGQDPYLTPNYLGQDYKKTVCDVPCQIIQDKTKSNEVDAIMFEAQPLGSFGYAYLKEQPLFPQKEVGQKFINFGFEHEDYFPIQTEDGYKAQINVNATFRQSDQVHLTFTCSWGMYSQGNIDNFRNAAVTPFAKKLPYIAFMATNCMGGGAIYRSNYIRDMMRYIKIDAMGECMQNKKLSEEEFPKPVFSDLGLSMKIKRQIFSRYMFSLAFENNNKTDYVSEKVYTCLLSGSLPIYMGAPNIDQYIPSKAVIKTDDFKSPQHLVEYLNYLISNQTAYDEYFEWKKQPYPKWFTEKYDKCIFYTGECNICKYVQKLINEDHANGLGNSSPQYRIDFGEPAAALKSTRVGTMTQGSCLEISQSDRIPPVDGEFTFAAWIYPESSQSRTLFTMGDAEHHTRITIAIYQVWRRYYVQFCLLRDDGDEDCITGERTIVHGTWRHIVVTVNKLDNHTEETAIYVNGHLDVSHVGPAHTTAPTATIKIGCDNSFEGEIDDLIVRRHGLNQHEVRQLMFSKYRGDESGLSVYLTFNDGAVVDYSKYKSSIKNTNVVVKDSTLRKLNLNDC